MKASSDSHITAVQLLALTAVPMIKPGDDLTAVVSAALKRAGWKLQSYDVLVVAQKIVSKAENRYAYLDEVEVTEQAQKIALETDKDAPMVQLILNESTHILKTRPGLIIAQHKLGWVMANAGIDHSNIESDNARQRVLLLPVDPQSSADTLREGLRQRFACASFGVVISDSVGRPWRLGTLGMALCASGVPGVIDRRGEADLFGRTLEVTQVGFADSVAAGAVLVMGEGSEALPLVVVRGLRWPHDERASCELIRDASADLFR